ncbi:hypothetical protein ABZX95_15415 [Streptomyces sp. NPDC004232]|uniref:hypothetical protein n=1 Tax=Streptomyces sp. NPDC004232 TaxID=3154454 RepID=UPI001D5169CA|nr:hypothetical protein [Streptomyces sp. tea 10]
MGAPGSAGCTSALLCAGAGGAVAGWAAARGCAGVLGDGTAGAALTTVAGTLALALVFLLLARLLKVGELRRLPGLR